MIMDRDQGTTRYSNCMSKMDEGEGKEDGEVHWGGLLQPWRNPRFVGPNNEWN